MHGLLLFQYRLFLGKKKQPEQRYQSWTAGYSHSPTEKMYLPFAFSIDIFLAIVLLCFHLWYLEYMNLSAKLKWHLWPMILQLDLRGVNFVLLAFKKFFQFIAFQLTLISKNINEISFVIFCVLSSCSFTLLHIYFFSFSHFPSYSVTL